ncbi:MAG TPA: ABC transporter permease [Gaiellaceae bacterium]|nr:ABC transporter permease [Gaiellaceae bacterium]
MFYVTYMLAELRRRRGRTILTALGLAVGVGLVVTVNALSTGLNDAQAKVLKPLTGVGTDMSVTRPISFQNPGGGNGGPGFPQLSQQERDQLRSENGGSRFGLGNLGKAGSHFSRDNFVAASQLSFPATQVEKISAIDGVSSAAGGLTLNAIHVEGTVPTQAQQEQQRQQFFQGGGQGGGGGGVFGGAPRNINLTNLTVTGVDQTQPQLGAVTPGQIAKGRYFGKAGASEAILDQSYASRQNLGVGKTIKVGGKKFTVVGIAKTPIGGQASDVYLELSTLQKLSDHMGRVNTVYVRANSASDVSSVSATITKTFDGASVTTAQDLADRVTGTLVDAKNLAGKLGTALIVLGLLAAFLIAILLTLASVTKRVRELGTLKALGWSQGLVVRQVTGESLLQGLLGGILGVALGLAGAALISAFGPELHATVAAAARTGPGRFFGGFGQGSVDNTPTSTRVSLDAPVSLALILGAIGLALLGGLIAGAAGGLRAARLRPADAIRHID